MTKIREVEKLIQQAEELFKGKKYKEIVDLLPDELLYQYNDGRLYAWRARGHDRLYENEIAFDYANKAIELNLSIPLAYLTRGNYWIHKNEFDKALEDYNKLIELDNKFAHAYSNRGNAWIFKREYNNAIADYNKAIELNNEYAAFYSNRGTAWVNKQEYDKAVLDYNKAIELDNKFANAFYGKGFVYDELNNIGEAIEAYEKFLSLSQNKEDFWVITAKTRIDELKQKLLYTSDYIEKEKGIKKLVEQIKELLVFEEDCITHYTTFSSAKALLLDKEKKAKFRLSEGAFMNDPSEGKNLFKFLEFSTTSENEDQKLTDVFIEKPFLGSFVAQAKHDDLTLWRMYGKELMQEAKGAALTLNRQQFINAIENSIKTKDSPDSLSYKDEFIFYRVAYIKKSGDNYNFIIPDVDQKIVKQLEVLMKDLKEKVAQIKEKNKIEITKLLNQIIYHFKSADYYYEHEVRLIISGIGFNKIIESHNERPKVFIELAEIVPAIHKITLGPKVEQAEEWAATFHYHIKEYYDNKVEIFISHLPFK